MHLPLPPANRSEMRAQIRLRVTVGHSLTSPRLTSRTGEVDGCWTVSSDRKVYHAEMSLPEVLEWAEIGSLGDVVLQELIGVDHAFDVLAREQALEHLRYRGDGRVATVVDLVLDRVLEQLVVGWFGVGNRLRRLGGWTSLLGGNRGFGCGPR